MENLIKIKKLLAERAARLELYAAVNTVVNNYDFTNSIRRSIIHAAVCQELGVPVSNQLVKKIKDALLLKEIVPTRTGNKSYYRNVNYCKNYSWLKFKYLKEI